ncbi:MULTISPECIES: YcjX family protein [unclassified Vibrio]|uniref:YcjX family protein n=1 Tax=Vibrio sp. HB236076 TaxID=3232307 RepID=A0AB39HDE4_9VIBR|nr:YcjX family protein [Vibrio sp. HB161653]MDP5253498.1 YcjX family protein [Vibrio sp. HB161653]
MVTLSREVHDFLQRGLNNQISIAVTGLSRAGKTAFITSFVNQLIHASPATLPMFEAVRQGRIVAAKRLPQTNLMVPRFGYDAAMSQLHASPSQWPLPTKDVSEIRLALKYRVASRTRRLLNETATLYIDLIDYPGEWLLDLPMLEMTYQQWCESYWQHQSADKQALAGGWHDALDELDPKANADENQLEQIANRYSQYLTELKAEGFSWVQPGRFILPGDLAGAPVLQFFPVALSAFEQPTQKGSQLELLNARFEQYKQQVVRRFYRDYFAKFDRQIVLVDVLGPLNRGYDAFWDMRLALEAILKNFHYGKSGVLQRLFGAKIDKLLFAASKSCHITPEQHPALLTLLQQMIHPAWQHTAFHPVEMECMTMSSIKSTRYGHVQQGGQNVAALQGLDLHGQPQTLFPGQVPTRLPEKSFWQQQSFQFEPFLPLPSEPDQALAHLNMDQVLHFLLGDKLK